MTPDFVEYQGTGVSSMFKLIVRKVGVLKLVTRVLSLLYLSPFLTVFMFEEFVGNVSLECVFTSPLFKSGTKRCPLNVIVHQKYGLFSRFKILLSTSMTRMCPILDLTCEEKAVSVWRK